MLSFSATDEAPTCNRSSKFTEKPSTKDSIYLYIDKCAIFHIGKTY